MVNLNKGGLLWWVGGLAFLVIGGMAVVPRLLGKASVVAPAPVPAQKIIQAVSTPAGMDYGVANSQYGRMRGYNFAGVAMEQPTAAMPLGFHLNNIM
jgi:hypothetical protein